MPMTVVNARVEAEDAVLARRVLEREGLNMSWVIRTTIEYVARTGSLPPFTLEEDEGDALQAARSATDFFESLPLAEPPEGWGDVALDRKLIEEEREARFE